MPALNFQKQWANAVEIGAKFANGEIGAAEIPLLEEGIKRTTIRKAGRLKPGDVLYLYTGMRTPACRKLGEVYCLSVTPLMILSDHTVLLGLRFIPFPFLDYLARLDTVGQLDSGKFVRFFEHHYGLPFEGELIAW